MSKYMWLSLGKGIAAILIVALHTSPLMSVGDNANFYLVNVIARWAVPFFFITSGFLFSLNRENKENYTGKYLKRLFLTYTFWIVIYTPHKMLYLYKSQTDIFTVKFIKSLFLDVFYNGYYQHMWYIPALAMAIIVVNWVLKKNKQKMACICAFLLYVIGVLGGMYANCEGNVVAKIVLKVFGTTRNGLFFGLPLVLLGVVLHKNIDKLRKTYSMYAVIVVCVLINFLEVWVVKSNNLSIEYSYGFTTFLVPASVILLLIKNGVYENKLLDKLTEFSQKYSLGIYYLHPLVIFCVTEILDYANIEYRYVSIPVFLFTVIASVTVIAIMKKMLENTRFKYCV